MAININFSLVLLLVVSGMSMGTISIPAAKADGEVKETKISVYFHDYFSLSYAPNSTDVAVVGFPGKNWNYTQFGTLFVLDDPVTEGPEPTSPAVGRLQGIYVITSLDGQNVGGSSSLVFTNGAYNGSTIQILGNSNQFSAIEEHGVASGTGKFRYANGYVLIETLSADPSTGYSLNRLNASIRHY